MIFLASVLPPTASPRVATASMLQRGQVRRRSSVGELVGGGPRSGGKKARDLENEIAETRAVSILRVISSPPEGEEAPERAHRHARGQCRGAGIPEYRDWQELDPRSRRQVQRRSAEQNGS